MGISQAPVEAALACLTHLFLLLHAFVSLRGVQRKMNLQQAQQHYHLPNVLDELKEQVGEYTL